MAATVLVAQQQGDYDETRGEDEDHEQQAHGENLVGQVDAVHEFLGQMHFLV